MTSFTGVDLARANPFSVRELRQAMIRAERAARTRMPHERFKALVQQAIAGAPRAASEYVVLDGSRLRSEASVPLVPLRELEWLLQKPHDALGAVEVHRDLLRDLLCQATAAIDKRDEDLGDDGVYDEPDEAEEFAGSPQRYTTLSSPHLH
jgi:hypothetical protein